jgi:hypothetical protein
MFEEQQIDDDFDDEELYGQLILESDKSSSIPR